MRPCQCITCHLNRLIDDLPWRFEMGRLDEKWSRAGGVVQRAEQRVEVKLDALIAREDEIAQKTEMVFSRHNAPLDESMAALDALDHKLDLLSNGGPDGPLPGSGDSQEAATKPAEQFLAATTTEDKAND